MARRNSKEKLPARLAYLEDLAEQNGWDVLSEEEDLDSSFRLSRFTSDSTPLPSYSSVGEDNSGRGTSLADMVLQSASAMPGPVGTIATGIRGAEALADSPTAQYTHEQFRAGWATRRAQALARRAQGMGLSMSPETDMALTAITAPFAAVRSLEEMFLPEEYLSERDRSREQEFRAEAQEAGERAQVLEDQIGGHYSPRAVGGRAVAGLLTQPEMALPTVGAIAGGALTRSPVGGAVGAGIGSIPMAQMAYDAAIDEASQWEGITDQERHEYGMMIAAAELGPDVAFGVLGAGLAGVFSKYGPKRIAKDAIEQAVRRRVGLRVAGAAGGGAVTENLAEDAGLAVRDWLSESDRISSEEARSDIALQVAQERAEGWRRRIDPTVAGGLMGGVVGGPTIGLAASAQAGRDAANTEREALRAAMDAGRRGEERRRESIESLFTQEEVTPVTEDTTAIDAQRQAEEDAAWEQRNLERAREENREAQRVSLERRVDTARENVEALQERIDEGDTSQATLNSFSNAIREQRDAETSLESFLRSPDANEVAATRRQEEESARQQELQRQQEAERSRAEQERQAREAQEAAARAEREKEVAARREALQRQQANQQRSQRRQQARERQRVMDEVISENPEASNAEILELTEQRLNDPAYEMEREVRAVRAREEAARRAQETRRRREAIRAARRANPEASDREIAAQLNQNRSEGEPEATVADVQAINEPQPQQHVTPIPEDAPVQQKINTLAQDMGLNLGMSASSVDANVPSYAGTYLDKTRKFIRGLVAMDTRGSVATQNLIRQGKLVIIPNPEFAGMPASNNVAEFSPETGEMFIYTDRMSDSPNAAREIVKAVHESGHFLQQGSREGRSATLESIFGNDGHNLIRQAASNGDERAQRAVARAEELFPDNEIVQNLEIPAYFYNEVIRDGSTLRGRLRNFVPNVVSRTRNLLRDRLGVDLQVTANDIAATVDAVLEEAVETDVQPQGAEASLDNLGMVVGERFARFAEAEREVPSYQGARDGMLRTEISDANAELMPLEQRVELNEQRKANDGRVTTTLRELIPHEDLYSGYEAVEGFGSLGDMPVKFEHLPAAFGMYSPPLTDRDMGGPRPESITMDSTMLHLATVIPEAPSLIPDFKGLTNEEALRRTLLHEMQHAIQAREGFIPGADARSFMRRSIVRDKERAEQRLSELASSFDLARAEESLPLSVAGLWQNEKRAAALVTPEAEAKLFLEQGYPEDSGDRLIRRFGERYREAQIDHAAAQLAYQEEWNRAFDIYRRDYGETEARNTEFRSRMDTEELAATPAETTMGTEEVGVPAERTLDSAQYTGGIRRPPASQNLGMSDVEAADAQPNSRRVLDVPARTWLRALFDPAIGTGREAQAIIENAAAAPSDTMLLVERYASEYDDALGDIAAERNTTPAAINEEITRRLDEISDREDSYDANLEAFRDVTKDYGKAGEALNRLRDKVDQLSMDMLEQRAQQAREGRALTPSERKTYSTIVNNLGRYAHRMYAAGLGKQGKKWSNSVWNDWKKGENAHNYHLVENAIKHLVDNDLYIPDAQEMAGVKTDQLRRLVETWGLGNPDTMTKADMQDALLNARDTINGDSGRLDSMAQSIVQELLGLKDQDSPITNYYRGGKINDAILRERKNIPAPLRELLGEITHPAGKLMVTAGKQAEFVARNRMLMELRQASETDPVMQRHIQPPNAAGTPEAEGMSALRGESYGPLEGYLVSPNMKALLADTVQQLATFEQATAMAAQRPGVLTDNTIRNFLGKYGTVARTEKAIKIIGNPANFLWNFVGAPDMLLKNGNLDPRISLKALNTAVDVIRSARSPRSTSENARRVQRAGVTDSAFIGEINKAQWRKLESIIREMEGKSPLEAWNRIRSGGATLVETYAMMDVWSKFANFYHQADVVLPAFYKAEGIERTQEQIDREAADIVNRTNITYKRAAPLVKAMEQAGLTQFGTYFYETFRVEVTNVLQGIDEIRRGNSATTPEGRNIMRNQGIKRLIGQTTSWILKGYGGYLLSKAFFGDDEEERRDTRSLFPDYLQNQDFVPMGYTDMHVGGRTMRMPVFINASRIDPTGPSSDLMRTMLHEDSDPTKLWKDIVDLYIAPRIVGQTYNALQATFGDKRISRVPLAEQVNVPGYSFVSNTFGANETRAWANVVESFLLGITTAYRDTNEIPDVEDFTSAVAFALTKAGATMYITDPSRAAARVGYEYNNEITALRREVADYFDTNTDGVNEDALLSRLVSMRGREQEAFEEVARVYRGAINVGLRPREISTILKNNNVPDEVIQQLHRGRFQSRFISKASIDRYAQNEMNKGNKSREEKREIKKKWDEAWRILNRQQRELRRNDG